MYRLSTFGLIALAALMLSILIAPASFANIIHVKTDGNDANDGLSWALAKATVQAGLNAAVSGDEVWVAAGTYVENITLKDGVGLYGGFVGTETLREQRDWNTNVTILDGNQSGSVVTAPEGATATTAIDGFTICKGRAHSGGGIYCYRCCPTIVNNVIRGNSGLDGGGIYSGYSALTIANNTVAGNSAYRGGGVYCEHCFSTITNNTIVGNNACEGGAIHCSVSSVPTVTNNILAFNSSGIRGGAPVLRSNCVYGNARYNYSILTDPTGTNGNMCVDPRLASVEYGNAHIQPDSPCIDAGDDSAVDSAWLDMDGQPRIQGAHVDIGADESDGTLWPPVTPTVIRVSLEGHDANDGSSWTLAKRTVQAGIDAASEGGGEVWVKAGVYYERITLRPYVYLCGGFAGIETVREQRDWASAVTVLDGEQAGSVVTAMSVGYLLSCIDGFSIRNGNASYGGGIYCSYSSLTITNNTIVGNSATWGGGVYCGYSSPAITNNAITGNIASGGGGVYCEYSSPTVTNNVITGNSASSSAGGGILCVSSSPAITNNTITANSALSYGGGIYWNRSSPTIAGNMIEGNSARKGGGIYCSGPSSATITNNTIIRNSASSYGGGICCVDSSATITENAIMENIASLEGGGIYCYYVFGIITHNSIRANRAGSDGSGIYCHFGSPTIANNTITGNGATGYSSGGIYCRHSCPTITNNTIAGNVGDGIFCYGSPSSPEVVNNIIAFNSSGVYNSYGTPVLRNNCVYGNTSGDYLGLPDPTGTDGNVSTDPELAALQYGNLHIQPNSPCIGAGDRTAVNPAWLDMDGQPRIQPADGTVDIGADESDGTLWEVIIRVSPTGDDANDGSSWELAKRTVQAGINVPASCQEIWVAAGTYEENITLDDGAALYGGFAGTETQRDQRDWTVNVTILDGNQARSVVTAPEGATGTTVIEGFTIRNGHSTYGGGIRCSSSSPTIANNTLVGNSAKFGGGVYCDSSSATITNNTITGNSAAYGGAIYCDDSSPMLTNNTIAANSACRGGGIECYGFYSRPSVVNNIIAFNSSGVYNDWAPPMLHSNCVYGNTQYNYSGLADPTGTDGNISVDPRLADIGYGDAHIQPDSPCIDAGDDGAVNPSWLDIDAQPRIHGEHVDIGSDESDCTLWPPVTPTIVRVSTEGDDSSDGVSWARAKRTIQAGVDAASAVGGEVWVKGGLYHERITLRPYAYLYGGFAGNEVSRSQRDWKLNVTTLDGGGEGSVVTSPVSNSGYRLSTIDGFTVRNGNASYRGGGVSCWTSSPTISNNVITANTAPTGAGVSCYYAAAVVAGNVICDNTASADGGGVSCYNCSPVIANNLIAHNAATTGKGGAVYCYPWASPTISGNVVASNTADSVGGVYANNRSFPCILNNTMVGNSSQAASGDAVYIIGYNDHPIVRNNIVAYNTSGFSLSYYGSEPCICSNCFYGNGSDDSYWTTNYPNILAQPLFVDKQDGDYHLTVTSPCINAGCNEAPGLPSTDIDGESRIQGDIVDIGADECWLAANTVRDTKLAADNVLVDLSDAVVSAAFPDFFYIEADDRSSGIRVEKAGHGLTEGMRADVAGSVQTNADGERYIAADSATPSGTGGVSPVGLANKLLGGGDWFYNPATGGGQKGVAGGCGLNNIGLLIRTWGKVTYADTGYFYLDDGSLLDDGSGHVGVKVLAPGLIIPAEGTHVEVTGISSCFKIGDDLHRLIRVRDQADIVVLHHEDPPPPPPF